MAAVKILLDSSPMYAEECPFFKFKAHECRINGCTCSCLWHFNDSENFDFGRCPFCTAHRETVQYND